MNRLDLARAAFNLNDPDQYSHFADDFQWSDSSGSATMNKSAWIAMGHLMRSAFPDLSYVLEDIREVGDEVAMTGHLAGTFTNDFDLSAVGMGTIPPTGKWVDFPRGTDLVSFEGDKVSRFYTRDTGADAGLPGFLKALNAVPKQ